MSGSSVTAKEYGLMAEFDSAQDLVNAAHKTHAAGYNKIDAYSPFPIEGLAEAIGFHKNRVPLVVLIGGLIGGLSGYALQYWVAAITYPTNIGGRPYHSWPSFFSVAFRPCSACSLLMACPCRITRCLTWMSSARLQKTSFSWSCFRATRITTRPARAAFCRDWRLA